MSGFRIVNAMIAGALLSGGVVAAGLGLGAGAAHATEGPSTWCPGQSMEWPSGPNSSRGHLNYVWGMNVCHTWYVVPDGWGNVPRIALNGQQTLQSSNAWDGDNPPGDNPGNVQCGLMWCPNPGGPGSRLPRLSAGCRTANHRAGTTMSFPRSTGRSPAAWPEGGSAGPPMRADHRPSSWLDVP
ncbi:hypothetical protein MLM_2464 [Mycobacterium lepraemurium]|nr:hypothetical protein MLM_2464 [Mycobacterium lepraemurium]